MSKNLKDIDFALLKLLNDLKEALLATWRNGYAEDCKSFYPSSILGVASIKIRHLKILNDFILYKDWCRDWLSNFILYFKPHELMLKSYIPTCDYKVYI